MLAKDGEADTWPNAAVHYPSLQGKCLVAAIWFPADWYASARREARILDYWQTGSRAFRFDRGDLLYFAEAQWLDCAALPGWPLQKLEQGLCSARLEESEQSQLTRADVWLVIGGELQALSLANAQLLDPASWLALDGLSLLDTLDCSVALPEPELLIHSEVRSVREVLGEAVPPQSQDLRNFLASRPQTGGPYTTVVISGLRLLRHVFWFMAGIFWLAVLFNLLDGADQIHETASTSAWLLGCWLLLLPGFLVLVWGLKRCVLGSLRKLAAEPDDVTATEHASSPVDKKSSAESSSGVIQSVAGTAVPSDSTEKEQKIIKAPRTLPQRVLSKVKSQQWRQWMVRLAKASLISRLIARNQADHLGRVMQMFQSGQLDEALRNAIPLGGDTDGSLGQAFGTLKRRDKLELSRQSGPAASIHLADAAQAELRRLYRMGFEKLDRDGRIDEAVFVLAELLNNRAEALDYLERHKRFSQAAELALSWHMEPAQIVRLQCLAGDWRMAVAVARRDRVFGDVVPLLEAKWPDMARKMRLEWGEFLAAQGDWLGAVNAVWPVKSAHDKAREWLQNAERNGGELAAKALVQRCLLIPESLEKYAEYIEMLRCERSRYIERAVIVDTAMALKGKIGAVSRLLRILVPMVLADQARGVGKYSSKALQRLFSLGGDSIFNADLPSGKLPVSMPASHWHDAKGIALSAPAAGTQAIFDAVPLLDGCYLLAQGETGVVMINNQGKTLFRFAVPAEVLVISENRQIALALMRRDEVWRVSRVDLAQRSVLELGMVMLEHFAREFDGVNWTVVARGVLRVLDTQHGLGTVVWQVADLPGRVVSLSVGRHMEQVLLQRADTLLELWRYRLPSRLLASRDEVPQHGEQEFMVLAPWAHGLFVGAETGVQENPLLYYRHADRGRRVMISGVPANPDSVCAGEAGMVLNFGTGTQACNMLVLADQAACKAFVNWPEARVSNRLVGDHWLAFDPAGRLFDLNLESGIQLALSI